MPAYFPMFINLEQKTFYIYGAGKIAARRTGGLLRYGARVKVMAPHIYEEVQNLQKTYPNQLRTEQRAYQRGEILPGEADFVLAATNDSKVNACIYQECREKGIPVNNASDSSQCDFYFPALVEQENLVIGVASVDGDHKKVAEFSKKLRHEKC